jgi:pimeloyl-ACP methyl ester carboxylesterase
MARMTELHVTLDDGSSITALDEGSGPVLLCLHPGGGDETAWDLVAAELTGDFRVVRVRRRIYVSGAAISTAHSMAVEAADILAIAGLLDRPVFLVGHSSGGVAALEAALADPSAFAGLFLYEPPMPTSAPLAGEDGARARAAVDAGDLVEAMRIHMRDIVRMPAEEVDAMFADDGIRAAFAAQAAAQITDDEAIDALGVGIDRFRALDLPTTLLQGDLSPAHLRARVTDLAATLPNVRVLTLRGQGHIAHFTAPDALAAAIREAAAEALR